MRVFVSELEFVHRNQRRLPQTQNGRIVGNSLQGVDTLVEFTGVSCNILDLVNSHQAGNGRIVEYLRQSLVHLHHALKAFEVLDLLSFLHFLSAAVLLATPVEFTFAVTVVFGATSAALTLCFTLATVGVPGFSPIRPGPYAYRCDNGDKQQFHDKVLISHVCSPDGPVPWG